MTFFNILWWVMLLLYIPAAVALVTIVLLQKGKGAGFAGAFGMGSGSETVFGPRLARTLPQKLTYAAAAVFMTLALCMSMISGKTSRGVAPELVEETDVTQQQIDKLLDDSAPVSTTTTEMPLVVNTPESTPAEGAAAPAPEGAAPATEAAPTAEGSDAGAPVEGIPVVVEEAPADAAPADAAPAEAAPADAAPADAAPAEAVPAEAAPAEAAPADAAPADAAAPTQEPAPAGEAAPAPAEENRRPSSRIIKVCYHRPKACALGRSH